MTPIEKNIIVVDEQGNTLEATYPKRAKGLVKKGRARFISENVICLACPPENLEDNAMSNTANRFNNVELLIDNYLTAQNTEPKDALMQAVADPRFETAVKAITEPKGKPTTAYLQRKLKIGYAIAATFLDAMEALGLVSPVHNMQPREVLPAAEEYLAYLSAK